MVDRITCAQSYYKTPIVYTMLAIYETNGMHTETKLFVYAQSPRSMACITETKLFVYAQSPCSIACITEVVVYTEL